MSLYKQKLNAVTGQFNLVSKNTAIRFRDTVPSEADLPVSGNVEGDGRITEDTNYLYVWDSTSWISQGDILNLKWAAIENKPTSSVADIDAIVSNGVISNADGDYKKVTKIQFNPTSGEIKVSYEE